MANNHSKHLFFIESLAFILNSYNSKLWSEMSWKSNNLLLNLHSDT